MVFSHSLSSPADLQNAIESTKTEGSKGIMLFKHSTRCSISSAALNRVTQWIEEVESKGIPVYYLDLIQFREVSNQIASQLGVHHESPQLIWVVDGRAVQDTSHFDIRKETVMEWLG
ncbi:MAG: bacillithiol system redox-active protein YtxJ [Schleiferiaceae bacterium]